MIDLEILRKEIRIPASTNKKPSMIIAHFNPKELDLMDFLQGGTKRNASGVRTYNSLYHSLLKHEPIKQSFLHHARNSHAGGGAVRHSLAQIKSHGRFGDSEIAYIPHGLAEIFDKAIGGRVSNPIDGHPEYFSLSGKLEPFMNLISRGASHLGTMARNAGHSLMSGARRVGSGISNGFNNLRNYVRGKPAPVVNHSISDRSIPEQSWRDWASSGIRENIGRPLDRGMRIAGGALGGYAANRAANSLSSAIPLPSSLVVAPSTAYGAYQGQKTGAKLASGVTNALASGAGALGSAADYVQNSPTIRSAAQTAQNAWNTANPVGHAYRLMQNAPKVPRSLYEGGPLIDDVD